MSLFPSWLWSSLPMLRVGDITGVMGKNRDPDVCAKPLFFSFDAITWNNDSRSVRQNQPPPIHCMCDWKVWKDTAAWPSLGPRSPNMSLTSQSQVGWRHIIFYSGWTMAVMKIIGLKEKKKWAAYLMDCFEFCIPAKRLQAWNYGLRFCLWN